MGRLYGAGVTKQRRLHVPSDGRRGQVFADYLGEHSFPSLRIRACCSISSRRVSPLFRQLLTVMTEPTRNRWYNKPGSVTFRHSALSPTYDGYRAGRHGHWVC